MANSPTMCQTYVDAAIRPLRETLPSSVTLIHYTDDLLLTAQHREKLLQYYNTLQQLLTQAKLHIAPDKIHITPPFQYLRYKITPNHITPSKIIIQTSHLNNLHDFQKLLGNIA